MSWWEILKMSEEIEWIMDHLKENIIIEMQGISGENIIDIILEIPINPDFIQWAEGKYKIDYLENISNLPGRKRYRIEAIGA